LDPQHEQYLEKCRLHNTTIRMRAAVRISPPMIPTKTIANGREAAKK